MEKSLKELLLKDLCARLLYGVMVYDKSAYPHASFIKEGNYKLTAQDISDYLSDDFHDFHKRLENIKSYLRPMSSMTDEEKMYVNELIYDKDGLFLSPIPTWVINECDIDKYIDFCNSKHLDWRGLISKGLALPAPDEMYNFK